MTAAALACRTADGPAEVTTVRDSAGTTITTIRTVPTDLSEWRLGRAEVTIRGPGDPSAAYFVEVADALWLTDGRILVVDAGSRRLHLFNSEGRYRATFGRRGEGPGEFARIRVVTVTRGDTIFAYDPSRSALQLFHPRAGFLRSITFLAADPKVSPFAIWPLEPDRFVRQWYRYDQPGPPVADGRLRLEFSTAVLDLIDETATTRAGPVEFDGSYSGAGEMGWYRLPFANTPFVFVGEQGILFGSGQDFHLTVLDPDTFRPRLEIRWPSFAEPIQDDEIERVAERLAGASPSTSARRWLRMVLSDDVVPESRPALQRALIDSDGRIWVARFEPPVAPPHERLWYVLDPRGRPLARLRLPDNSHLTAVAGNRILLVQRDSLDIASVSVFHLLR